MLRSRFFDVLESKFFFTKSLNQFFFSRLEFSDDNGAGARLEISKDRLAVPSLSPEPESRTHHPSRSRRKKGPRPKSAPKRSSSSPLADYTSPEEEEEEAFSEEEIKLPIDDDEYEEEEKVADDPGEFQHLEENSQVNWQEQEN